MNSMEARRAELEKKRQKLEQLRNERLKAKEEKERQQRLQAAAAGVGSPLCSVASLCFEWTKASDCGCWL